MCDLRIVLARYGGIGIYSYLHVHTHRDGFSIEIQLKDSGGGRDTYSHSLISVGSADISDAPGLSLRLL